MSLIIPENYKSNLNGRETEKAIKFIKDTFQHEIISALNLQRISAPLFVRPETGLNDNLNGVERPVKVLMHLVSAVLHLKLFIHLQSGRE